MGHMHMLACLCPFMPQIRSICRLICFLAGRRLALKKRTAQCPRTLVPSAVPSPIEPRAASTRRGRGNKGSGGRLEKLVPPLILGQLHQIDFALV